MRAKRWAANRLVRLHFVMGGIYNALEEPDESLNCYKKASENVKKLPEEGKLSESANCKAVLDLKLAEHQMRTKDYQEAQ